MATLELIRIGQIHPHFQNRTNRFIQGLDTEWERRVKGAPEVSGMGIGSNQWIVVPVGDRE